jgi:hypothetical protein
MLGRLFRDRYTLLRCTVLSGGARVTATKLASLPLPVAIWVCRPRVLQDQGLSRPPRNRCCHGALHSQVMTAFQTAHTNTLRGLSATRTTTPYGASAGRALSSRSVRGSAATARSVRGLSPVLLQDTLCRRRHG